MDDWDLIREYASSGSQEAFRTLVGRYVDFVYSAALRQVRDRLQIFQISRVRQRVEIDHQLIRIVNNPVPDKLRSDESRSACYEYGHVFYYSISFTD